jgi:hypothetical protein
MTAKAGAMAACALGVCLVFAASPVSRAAESDLPYVAPGEVRPVPYAVELTPSGAVKVTLKGDSRVIVSDFSLVPGWAKLDGEASSGFDSVTVTGDSLAAETKGFSLNRKFTKHDECVEVADTLTNKTSENLPVMVRHKASLAKVDQFWLGGRKVYLKRAQSAMPENPTTICSTPTGSFGLIALDDVFRVHCTNFALPDGYGISEGNLVLKPNASITLRWAVFVRQDSGYYPMINAMRRFLDVNYQVQGPGVCGEPRQPNTFTPDTHLLIPGRDSPVEAWRNVLTCKNAHFLICGRAETGVSERDGKREAIGLNGPDWLASVDVKLYKDFFANKIKAACPESLTSIYFSHSFYALPDGKQKYAGCEVLNPDGSQADYGDPKYPLWLSVEGNAYARDLEKTLDLIMNVIGTDGVYWDEFEQSAATWHFGQPWDGVSADIDPTTHKIAGLKSRHALLTQPWRVKLVKRILDSGKYLIVNGGPATETMTKLHFMRFTETGSIGNCVRMHLTTPIALGDHLTERTETDCYRCMLAALKFGCVYYWYWDGVGPITFHTLTDYMFPITPVELGEGYILGKERIVTARSGWFSFGDNSAFVVHFFNAEGVETPRIPRFERKDGKNWCKVELAENESCALVRKEAQ